MRATLLSFALLLVACGSSTSPAVEKPPTEPVAAAQPAEPAAEQSAASSTVETRSFHSQALGVDKRYVVYLPAGYQSSADQRYPVLYMLHGLGGKETNWRDLGIAEIADQLDFPGIIVMPDGDDSFYVNWVDEVDYQACLSSRRPFGKAKNMKTYCVKQANYGDYIARDLVGHVDATYRTVADREARAIGGLSMGGYGALYHAMKHPELFSTVVSHAGVASITYAGPHPYQEGKAELGRDPKEYLQESGRFGQLFRRIWGEQLANWKAHDPTTLATELEPGQLAIYVDVGTADEFKLEDANQYLHEVLKREGIDHTFHLIEGGHHDDAFWKARVDDSLSFVKRQFGGVAGR